MLLCWQVPSYDHAKHTLLDLGGLRVVCLIDVSRYYCKCLIFAVCCRLCARGQPAGRAMLWICRVSVQSLCRCFLRRTPQPCRLPVPLRVQHAGWSCSCRSYQSGGFGKESDYVAAAGSKDSWPLLLCKFLQVSESIYARLKHARTRRGALYRSTVDCLAKTAAAEGVGAWFRGFSMQWMRLGPHTTISLMCFEQLRRLATWLLFVKSVKSYEATCNCLRVFNNKLRLE